MLATPGSNLQIAVVIVGTLFVLMGAIVAYVGFLGANGRIKPNGAMGARFNISRNYRLYNQEKYWYEINRYGGKRVLPVAIAWILLSAAAVALPLDPGIKMGLLVVILMLVMIALILDAWHIYHYADRLVSRDKQYIPKA